MFLDQIEKRIAQAKAGQDDSLRRAKLALASVGPDDGPQRTCGVRIPPQAHSRLKRLVDAGKYPSIRAAALDMLLTGLVVTPEPEAPARPVAVPTPRPPV